MKEACLSVFAHQEEIIFHGFQDPMAILLQSSVKEEFVLLIISYFGFNFFFSCHLLHLSAYLRKM
jgi:hypothetical protein